LTSSSELVQALNRDASGLGITQTSGSGDNASVQIVGTMKISLDAPRLRELFKKMAEQRGQPFDDAQLDGLVSPLQAVTQSVPVNPDRRRRAR
jgi:hypothetical protein